MKAVREVHRFLEISHRAASMDFLDHTARNHGDLIVSTLTLGGIVRCR
jgi:hypothetical protein